MSDTHERRPIVVRRKKHGGGHGSGSHGTWKIAYADFMTAMMAFFLVMWLLGGLSKIQYEQVSEYFRTPLKVALVGGNQSSASDSAIPGGGDDHIHSDGKVALTTLDARNYRSGHHELQALKQKLQQQIDNDPALKKLSSQLRIDLVPDGLRIQIFDSQRRPMFELGSARLEPYVADLLAKIAPNFNDVPNRITLTGHTDDIAYPAGPAAAYGNWELSSDRANAARRALMIGGLSPDRLLRVIGAADTVGLPGDGPAAAVNRRISIVVLNAEAQRRIELQGESAPAAPAPGKRAASTAATADAATTHAAAIAQRTPPA